MAQSLFQNRLLAKAVDGLRERAERHPSTEHLVATFVDPGNLTARLDNDNNQLLFGRRGTGKTHVLRVLAAQHNDVSVYVDMRPIRDTPRVGDETLPDELRAAAVFQMLLREIRATIAELLSSQAREFLHTDPAAIKAFDKVISDASLAGESISHEGTRTSSQRVDGSRGQILGLSELRSERESQSKSS